MLTDPVHRVCPGIATYLLVNASELERPGHVSLVELVDLRGDSLTDLVITAHTQTVYNSSAFIPPDKYFYIKVLPSFSSYLSSSSSSSSLLS